VKKSLSSIAPFIFLVAILMGPVIFVCHLINKDWTDANRPMVGLIAFCVSFIVALGIRKKGYI
jgi:maltodextrin utilization protein YvdJ